MVIALLVITNTYFILALGYFTIFSFTMLSWWRKGAKQLRACNAQEDYNYGITQTFRESIASKTSESYYGVQDLTMYWKSIEQAILDGTIRILKHHGVNTSQFEQVATTITNTGIMVSGGNFSAQQIAAGTGASNVINKTSQYPRFQKIKSAVDRVMNPIK